MRSPDTVSHSTVRVFCAPPVQGLQSSLYHCNTQSSGEYITSTSAAHVAVTVFTVPLLTINGVDGNSRCAPRKAAGYKRHVERSRPIYASFAQVIQVGKQREIDDGEWNVPTKREK